MFKKLALITASLISVSTFADEEQAKFNQYVADLKVEAIEKGFSQTIVDNAFATVKFKKKVIKADKIT